MKITVIEELELVRDMFTALCRGLWPQADVSAAETGAAGLHLGRTLQPDLLFVDLLLPDCDGLRLVQDLRQASPSSKVVALTALVDEFTVHQALRANVHALIAKKEQPLDRFGEVIAVVLSGGQYLSPTVRAVRDALRSDPRAFDKVLSEREQHLLGFFGAGMSNRLIAEKFGLSTNTVQVHRRNILGKLGMHSTPELMNYALEKGFRRHVGPRGWQERGAA